MEMTLNAFMCFYIKKIWMKFRYILLCCLNFDIYFFSFNLIQYLLYASVYTMVNEYILL